MFSKSKKHKGFTIIELMIVISIIGILSGLILTVIDPEKQRARARDGVRQKDLGIIATALEQYYADNNSYPTTSSIATLESTYLENSNYLQIFPHDPKSGYAYCYTGSGQIFTLCASIEALSDAVTGGACSPTGGAGDLGSYCVTNSF